MRVTTSDRQGDTSDKVPAEEPKSATEALKSPEANEWRAAMEEEWKSLVGNGTWDNEDPGKLPEGRQAISTKWIFKRKLKEDGTVARYKARLVAQGFSQVEGEDFFETSAPVARMSTLRTVFSLTAEHDFELESMDVDTAYLNAPVEEELFVKLPTEFSQSHSSVPFVRRLRRSLYGLKQSGRNWNKTLDDFCAALDSCSRVSIRACTFPETKGKKPICSLQYM